MVSALLNRLAAVVLSLFVLFEELAWGLVDALGGLFDRLFPMEAFHRWLRQRSRWEALVLFGLLLAVAEGGKLAALGLIGGGQFWAGLGVLIALKIVGGLMVVTLWRECRAQLLAFSVIAWAHRLIIEWRAQVHGWLDRLPLWRAVRDSVQAARALVRRWVTRAR